MSAPDSPRIPTPFGARLKQIRPLFSLLLAGAALWVVHNELRHLHYADLLDALKVVPAGRVAAALLLTALNFLVLTGYDTLAIRYAGRALAYPRIALASFFGYAFSQALGFPLLTGVPLRFRLYTEWGLSAVEVGRALAFSIVSYTLGLVTLAGLAFVIKPLGIPPALHLPIGDTRLVGVLFVAVTVAYVGFTRTRGRPLRVGSTEFAVPPLSVTALQILLGCLDWLLAATVLFVLLPQESHVSFFVFLGIFLLAQLTGLVSNMPGGLGVFEAVVLLLFPGSGPQSLLLASLLTYRAVYYLTPLLLATTGLAAYELRRGGGRIQRALEFMGHGISSLVPVALAGMTFLAGVILLFSGATPAAATRLSHLARFLPLPFIEISHLLGSVAGVGLLILAWGIQRRLDVAYHLVTALLAAGMVLSLLKGLDYEEAIVLGTTLVFIIPSHREFYRRASLLREPLSRGWTTAVAVALIATAWLALFSFNHVAYSNELWWQFAVDQEAPRTLRALVAALATAFGFALMHLLRPAPPAPSLRTPAQMEAAERLVRAEARTFAHLALLGDKALLFGPNRRSMLMYAVEGRSWIAMGDPIGAEEDRAELAWEFRGLADRYGGWPVFYQVHPDTLPVYLDLGMALLKLGEEARVPLDTFDLGGSHWKKVRHTLHRAEHLGCVFEVIPAPEVSSILADLRPVSDAWLVSKGTREKRFSLGFFDEDYLSRTPVAVVRCGGTPVAFANLWIGGGGAELTVDLMRYTPDAPYGIMDFLFVHLMLWGKERGFRWFNLGMAPFSGLEGRPASPLWNRLGAAVYQFGENFYNFQGLRAYKDKFRPVWEPRYLASPGGLVLPRILTNLATLVSGGLGGVFSR